MPIIGLLALCGMTPLRGVLLIFMLKKVICLRKPPTRQKHWRTRNGCEFCILNSLCWYNKKRMLDKHPTSSYSASAISRVLYSAKAKPLSFIYDCGHPQPPATYPPTLDEQPLIVGIHGLATRKAYCRKTLLPSRWALTPPFHPYRGVRKVRVRIAPRPYPAKAVILCYATIPSRTSSR